MKTKKIDKKRIIPKLELNTVNLALFIVGLVVLAVGYYLLSKGPWNNPLSLSVAPIVLLIGYLLVFPLAIFFGSRRKPEDAPDSRQVPAKKR